MASYIPILVIGGFLFIAVVGILVTRAVGSYLVGDELTERMGAYASLPGQGTRSKSNRGRSRFNRMRVQVNSMLSAMASADLSLQLLSANWPITETEFLLIRFGGAAVAFLLGWLIFRSIFPGIGLALLAYMVPVVYLRSAITRRRGAFERQLIDVLVLITGAVRAGYSLQQALDVVSREIAAPASDEFRRINYEVSLGLPLSQALTNLTTRMHNDDLYLVVTAININYQVGGNLVVMLESVTKTIRERVRLFGEIRTLTSQQRFNSYLLTLMPVGITAVLFVINPKYISRLFQGDIWLCFPIGAAITTILGNIVIRKLSTINV